MTVVCILGMHRSGTSLVARTLNLLGVYLGRDEDLMAPTQYNPTGFWERNDIINLNDKLLERLGGTWRNPPFFHPEWFHDDALSDLVEEARGLVDRAFAAHVRWGFKDPRGSLTLPFWKQVLPVAQYVLCLHVLCLRNPLDVAASLSHTMRSRGAFELWLAYTVSGLRHTHGSDRVLISYEDLVAEPVRETQRLARFLALDAVDIAANPDRAAAFSSQDLQHHHSNLRELLASPDVPLDMVPCPSFQQRLDAAMSAAVSTRRSR